MGTYRRIGAASGSGIVRPGSWAVGEPLVKDLKTSTARAMYNHSETRNVWFYMYAGAKGTISGICQVKMIKGAVAYHSAGGIAGSSGTSLCNP